MSAAFAPGDRVQTALGKGTVREVRNRDSLLVDVLGRSLVFDVSSVTRLAADQADRKAAKATKVARQRSMEPPAVAPGPAAGPARVRELDLHGCTVEEALARVDAMLDRCMRDDIAQLRVIHGRSGGRIRAALHRRLAAIPSVRAFAVDAGNDGVTVVFL